MTPQHDYDKGYEAGQRDAELQFRRLMDNAVIERRRPANAPAVSKPRKKNPNLKKRRNAAIPRICDICDKEFKYPAGLRRHLRTHEPRVCRKCGEVFDTPQGLGSHTRWNPDCTSEEE